jgi:hypothetical protein
MDRGTTNTVPIQRAQRIGCMGMLLLCVAGVGAFAVVLIPLILLSSAFGLSQSALPRVGGIVATGAAVTVIMTMARRLRRPITYS